MLLQSSEMAKTHTKCNLLVSLIAELGELAEHFEWKEHDCIHLDQKKIDKIAQELADISIYLMRFADISGIQTLFLHPNDSAS